MKCNLLVLFSIVALFLVASVQAVDKSVCSQAKDPGPCRKADPKFYYDSELKACQEFYYGGCQGNDNRFDSQEECDALCVTKS